MLFISQDHQYAGKNGVVRAIMNNIASVYLYDDGQEIDVPTRSIEPTAPSKFDKVSYCTHSSYTVHCSVCCMLPLTCTRTQGMSLGHTLFVCMCLWIIDFVCPHVM